MKRKRVLWVHTPSIGEYNTVEPLLKKLREEGNYKDYIALKYGSVINPSTLKRFVFPYVDPDDEDYPFMYGMVIRDILNGDIETLKRILNFD